MKKKIKELYIFDGLESNLIEKIFNSGKVRKVKRGIDVIKKGEVSKEAYIIIDGIVSVNIGEENISTIFEGDIFGEIGLVLDEIRTATVRAETDLELLVLKRKIIFEILSKEPEGDYIKKTILNRIIQNNKKLK